MENNLPVFDFDGVIADSINEQAVTALNAVNLSRGIPTLFTELSELPSGYLDRFRSFRPYFHKAHTVALLGAWCEGNSVFPGKDVFNNFKEHLRKSDQQLRDEFFEARIKLLAYAPDKWAALNQPFPDLWQVVLKLDRMIIVTDKNESAVRTLCSYWGRKLLPTDYVFAGDSNETKSEHFVKLLDIFPHSQFHFVEDSLENLKIIRENFPKRVTGYLATWGYVDDATKIAAEKSGFRLLTESNVQTLLAL